MADTETSIATLLATNFADGQAAGEITPQDMRDLIISLESAYGGYYISSASATTIAAVDTPVKVAGTTTAFGSLNGFTMPTDNRMLNAGTGTRICQVQAAISFTSANNNKVYGFMIAKNGTVEANSEVQHKVGTAADVQGLTIAWQVSLDATDYLEVWVQNRTDGDNPTITLMTVSVEGHIV
jgi:hypothetical protein